MSRFAPFVAAEPIYNRPPLGAPDTDLFEDDFVPAFDGYSVAHLQIALAGDSVVKLAVKEGLTTKVIPLNSGDPVVAAEGLHAFSFVVHSSHRYNVRLGSDVGVDLLYLTHVREG